MNPILIINCEVKRFFSLSIIAFGFALTAGIGFMLFKGSSLWWLLGIAFGVFCIYRWTNILRQGGRSMVFLVKEEQLYFTYEQTSLVLDKLEDIKTNNFYTERYKLSEIQNFWRLLRAAMGAVNTDLLYFRYQNEKKQLANLSFHFVDLEERDLNEIAAFLQEHNPNIELGANPPYFGYSPELPSEQTE
jgi:hypothetical protein